MWRAPRGHAEPQGDTHVRLSPVGEGRRTVAAVLTGIGSDGADGAVAVDAAGGIVLAQDEATSVVWGMPKVVAERGVARAVVPLQDVAGQIMARLGDLGRSRERVHA